MYPSLTKRDETGRWRSWDGSGKILAVGLHYMRCGMCREVRAIPVEHRSEREADRQHCSYRDKNVDERLYR
jgi:hypothetical protein